MEKIMEVTAIKLAVLESFPPQLSIHASGRVSTIGWTNPRLEPHKTFQAPPDGIYDFDFVAERPTGIVADHVTPIEASYVMHPFPETLKGVRVHASGNSKTALLDSGEPNKEPNRYTFTDLEGSRRIVFFPLELGPLIIGRAPRPELKYSGPEGQMRFRGDDIRQEKTVLGTLISVMLRPNADAGQVDFALVLPPVYLAKEADRPFQKSQKFETAGVVIKGRGRMIEPVGAQLTYEVIRLDGLAEDVPVPQQAETAGEQQGR
jgi:hypothetical protein